MQCIQYVDDDVTVTSNKEPPSPFEQLITYYYEQGNGFRLDVQQKQH